MTKETAELGERMELAAEAARLDAKDIALRMGMNEQAGSIYRWWRGERVPSGPRLVRTLVHQGVVPGIKLGRLVRVDLERLEEVIRAGVIQKD